MGNKMFDLWSYGHFFLGYLSKIVIFPNNPFISFIISNMIHLIIELNEKKVTPTGVILETTRNIIGDNLIFSLGWLIAYITCFKKLNKYVYLVLAGILLIAYLEQLLREIFPNTDFYFTSGAFLPYK